MQFLLSLAYGRLRKRVEKNWMEDSMKLILNSSICLLSGGQSHHLYCQSMSPMWTVVSMQLWCQASWGLLSAYASVSLPFMPFSLFLLPFLMRWPEGCYSDPVRLWSLISGLCEVLHGIEGICILRNAAVFESVLGILSCARAFILHAGLFFKFK